MEIRLITPGAGSGGGAIVNISYAAARMGGVVGWAAYAASKGGILALTKVLAMEYGRHGIRINVMAPGGTPREIVTRLNRDINDALASAEVRGILTKAQIRPRGGSPEDFGALMKSEAAKWGPVIKYTGARLD